MKETKSKIVSADVQPHPSLRKTNKYLFLIPLLIGFAGFVVLFLSSSENGIGISGDSVQYIKWASNFLQYHTFTTPDGESLTLWPPLYPLLIAFLKTVGIDNFLAIRLISSVSFGLIIFITGLWILKYLKSPLLAIAGSLVIFSKAIIVACCWALSDPLYILFTLMFFLLIPKIINNPTYKSVLLLAVITAAACVTRYTGVVLYPAGAIALFFGIKQFRKKFTFTFVWGIVSIIPIGLWMLRNYRLTGTLTGLRFTRYRSLLPILNDSGNFFKTWFIGENAENIPGWFFLALFFIFILIILAACVYRLIKSKNTDWPVLAICTFIIIYTLLLIHSAFNTAFGGPMEERFLSPLYPLLVILIALSAIKIYSLTAKYARWSAVIAFALCTSFWLYTGMNHTYHTMQYLHYRGFGMASIAWKNSPTIAWMKNNNLDGKIYTNDSCAIYILTGIDASLSPPKQDSNLNAEQNRLMRDAMDKFQSELKSGKQAYLVWFARHFRTYLYDPQQLQQFCNMRLVAQLNDGIVIALYPKDFSSPNK